ncbi:phage holin [Bacillus velezensis]|uniref:phage holin n=1 Tax=Bacillus amyloliquefaciens group TaxID=1938374 RepID=UPI0006246D44|nr:MULTISPECIES: phage holin [Bacillus amyloliquefaciens group]AKF31543.1 holin [Bacillus velezensis]MEC0403842.1 phage holin [Bacillus velezensis]MEC3674770.1 phage holin [Bacillus velezensis]QAW25615.1 phage holin [Bacillus velezensis]QTU91780.1 phage holin [Bacillus velezensis]
MKNFDKGTVVRTVLLLIALINQTMLMLGKSPLEITDVQVNQLADALYTAGSVIFTISTTLVAWFKNNYVTGKGHKQRAVLKQHDLTK